MQQFQLTISTRKTRGGFQLFYVLSCQILLHMTQIAVRSDVYTPGANTF